MLVNVPANFTNPSHIYKPGDAPGDPAGTNPPINPPPPSRGEQDNGIKATVAYFPDDPSNVYHSYMRDHVKMRIFHGEGSMHHLHHLHAHQWLHSPNSANGHYLDSQLIGPGASFTLEMVYNGSGNRNQTVGDSIFHCHFYPHFAEGMWSLWRVHDVFEAGTELEADHITPTDNSRALPDGEIQVGTPIPALVPLPTLPMAPMPSAVHIDKGQVVYGTKSDADPTGNSVVTNPGYPFFIPGIAGQRPPHPPMDMAVLEGEVLDGGLLRHLVMGTLAESEQVEYHNRFDFSNSTVVSSRKSLKSLTHH